MTGPAQRVQAVGRPFAPREQRAPCSRRCTVARHCTARYTECPAISMPLHVAQIRPRACVCAYTRLRDMRATTEQWNRAVSIGAQIQAEERLKPSPVRSETNLRDGTPGTPVDRGRRGQRHRHNRMATPGVCGAPVRQARLVA